MYVPTPFCRLARSGSSAGEQAPTVAGSTLAARMCVVVEQVPGGHDDELAGGDHAGHGVGHASTKARSTGISPTE
jgi:hypothetical protein